MITQGGYSDSPRLWWCEVASNGHLLLLWRLDTGNKWAHDINLEQLFQYQNNIIIIIIKVHRQKAKYKHNVCIH